MRISRPVRVLVLFASVVIFSAGPVPVRVNVVRFCVRAVGPHEKAVGPHEKAVGLMQATDRQGAQYRLALDQKRRCGN